MNSKISSQIVSLLAAAFIGAPICPAEAPKELDHTVQFPEGDASWAITIEKLAPTEKRPGPAARDIKRILVVQKGGMRRDTVSWSDGATTEYWWIAKSNTVFFQTEAGGAVRKMRASQMGTRKFDASTFSWVGKETFVKEQAYKGKQCQAYESQVTVADGEKQTIFAWIDQKTMRPVAWSDGLMTAVFTFDLPVPDEPLVMPEPIKKEFLRYQAYLSPPKLLGRQRILR